MHRKWAVTEQFHEYLTPYGKNRNEFVVRTDNNPLTYIFSSAHLDAAGHRWVASLADYNFSLEYQKGKDHTVADFLSRMDNRLPEEEVEEALCRVEIPAPGVKAMLDNADTSIVERAEMGDDVPPHKGLFGWDFISLSSQVHYPSGGRLEEGSKGRPCSQHSGQESEVL